VVFIQPKISSTRLRMRSLMAYAGRQDVRPSMALRRPLVFWATWGVTPAARTCATRSRIS
jgi:hypothetical protein